MELSVVIPVLDEGNSILHLYNQVRNNLIGRFDYEILFIDDGSVDGSYETLLGLANEDNRVRLFRFTSNVGQHKALEKGFKEARGEIIVTMDADLQSDPQDISRFVEKIKEGHDMVCGWRFQRQDPWHKKLKSKLGNCILRMVVKSGLHDLSCPFRAYRIELVKGLSFQNKYEISFIPWLIFKRTKSVAEIQINANRRLFGRSKYSFFPTVLFTVICFFRYLFTK